MSLEDFWAVVPAGGAGTRLWPLSRSAAPKFLRDLTGSGRSLLQETVDRLQPLAEGVMVVTGAAHVDAVNEQLPTGCAVLAEPSGRDSMAAIGWAAAVLEAQHPDAIMGSFAADHVIKNKTAFGEAVSTAVAAAVEGWLVTIGIDPTFPSPGFGYIRQGDQLAELPGCYAVEEFVEKPSVEIAEKYIEDGDYRWNAGMFVVRPSVLLDLLAEYDAEFAARLRLLAAEPDRIEEIWSELPQIALDHAIAEPAAAAGRIVMVPADLGWDDVGDFDSLAALLDEAMKGSADGPTVLGDQNLVHAIESSGLIVPGGGRTIAVIGLEDIVVVDTPDAVLVTTRARAQQVKQVVSGLQKSHRQHLT
jgi:mannose-1-phosphate guanylyltransferase